MQNKEWGWLNEMSREFLGRGYLAEGQSAEDRVRVIGKEAEKWVAEAGYAKKFEEYMSKGWISLSSPVWSNFGTDKGLPISCFGSYIEDTMGSILNTQAEVGMMSKFGGGCSGYFGDLRGRGEVISGNGVSSGAVHFIQLFETLTDVVSQGCYDDTTEVLTESGWMSFSEANEKGVDIAQVTDEDEVEFVQPSDYITFKPEDKLIRFSDSKNIDLVVTKNHKMQYKYEAKVRKNNQPVTRYIKEEYRTVEAIEAPLHRDIKWVHSSFAKNGNGMSAYEKFLIAFQADGTQSYPKCETATRFRFSKEMKRIELEAILEELGWDYTYSFYESDNTHNFYLNQKEVFSKSLSDIKNLKDVTYKWAVEFMGEVSKWDGHIVSEDAFSYSSTLKSNTAYIQAVAALCGKKSYCNSLDDRDGNRVTLHQIYVSDRQYFGVENIVKEEVEYDGFVHCFEVPSHRLIVRSNGRTLVSGNSVRRGHFSPYLPVEHPDILEFLEIGTEGNPIQKLTHGITVGDEWMQSMVDGDVDKREIWARVLQRRKEMGYPYIMFSDNANNGKPQVYKDKGLDIYASNMCSEIMLPSSKDWSFVCCLSSVNLLHYEEWKDTDLVETMVKLLDAVISEFISKLEAMRDSGLSEDQLAFKFLERAYNFAKANRAVGLGVLGYHSLLQSRNIQFTSDTAKEINISIFKNIETQAYNTSVKLAEKLGEPEILKGYGRRNTTLMAIAPTTSSAFILGQVSQGIEPVWSNCYIKDLAKTKVVIKNPQLQILLEAKGMDTKEMWDSIRDNDGSVQHLDILSDKEKTVFLTFGEMDQSKIIEHAADRQKYIDQGQSLNVKVHPEITAKEMNQLSIQAWDSGIKAMYYQHSNNAAQNMARSKLSKK